MINTLHIKNVILYNEVVDLAEMRFVFNVYVFIYLLFMISFLCLFVAGLLTVHEFKKKKNYKFLSFSTEKFNRKKTQGKISWKQLKEYNLYSQIPSIQILIRIFFFYLQNLLNIHYTRSQDCTVSLHNYISTDSLDRTKGKDRHLHNYVQCIPYHKLEKKKKTTRKYQIYVKFM